MLSVLDFDIDDATTRVIARDFAWTVACVQGPRAKTVPHSQ